MNTRFLGKFHYSVDNKGRVNVPAKFRNILTKDNEDTLVITIGPNCLRLFPSYIWNEYETNLIYCEGTPEELDYKRFIYSLLADSTLDSQGRITLTQELMNFAGIEKEVTFVGTGNYIELWDKNRYEEYCKGLNQTYDYKNKYFEMQALMFKNYRPELRNDKE